MLAVVILTDALSTAKFGLLGVLDGCSHVSRGFPKGCPISLRVEDLHLDARNVN